MLERIIEGRQTHYCVCLNNAISNLGVFNQI